MLTTQNIADSTSSDAAESAAIAVPTIKPRRDDRDSSRINHESGDSRIVRGPLMLDGWLEFNRIKHGLQPQRYRYTQGSNNEAILEAVLYLDKSGKIRHPWRNPYMPVAFVPTQTSQSHKKTYQWVELANQLVDEMRERGVANTVNLCPQVSDIRPWQWAHFQVGVKYTCTIDLPYRVEIASQDARRRIRQCPLDGFRVARTTDLAEAADCLIASEKRQGYSLDVNRHDLELARSLLGDDAFRIYAVYAPDGTMATASVVLHRAGSAAVGWVAGTRQEYLNAGVTQFVDYVTMQELYEDGATSLDLAGANIRSVAIPKFRLGATLVPYYSIESYSLRRLAKWTKNWWTATRQVDR
jgi:hypothetical protein